MKQVWENTANKINDLTLRERIVIFGMLATTLIAFVDAVFWGPSSNKETILSQQLLQMNGEIQSLQEEIQTVQTTEINDPNVAIQSRLVVVKEQLAAINLSLQGKQQQLIAPDEISQMLETILIQNRELQLVTLSNLPVEALIASPAEENADTPEEFDQTNIQPQVNYEPSGQIFKHSVEITIQGEYFNLLAYLDELEKIPSQMYWDQVTLSVDDYPSTILTLSVYTLSLDETWLKV